MKILFYCQYVWGIGHLFRSLEICRALSAHEVILVSGGLPVDVSLPAHVREVRLPGLMVDDDYRTLVSRTDGKSVDRIKRQRQARLLELFEKEAPDIFLVELYPFGRRAFRFELDPVFKAIRSGELPPSLVVCSLRDILVEKKDPASYEKRVIDALRRYFDAVLVHSDPCLLKLDETFSRTRDIGIPIVYTGFVTPKPAPGAREKLRLRLGVGDDAHLIVASAGGGRSGGPLLEAVVAAIPLASMDGAIHLHVFTGPFASSALLDRLKARSSRRIRIRRFTRDFLSYLAAADLSVSMAGYNTSMNILAARVPSLVWPFSGDREQSVRAAKMARIGASQVLARNDLKPVRMAEFIKNALARGSRPAHPVNLEGAAHTAQWLGSFGKGERGKTPNA